MSEVKQLLSIATEDLETAKIFSSFNAIAPAYLALTMPCTTPHKPYSYPQD